MNTRVTYYQRRSQGSNFSIEKVFSDVRKAMPEGVKVKVSISTFPSRGLWRRVYNAIEAVFRQGDINHITGDVHYLAILLDPRRTLLTIHDLVTVHRLEGLRKRVFLFLWYWFPVKRSSAVTVISSATKEDLLRQIKIDPEKVSIVNDCISNDFSYSRKPFNETRPVILQIGAGKNKNVERVVEALRDIPCHYRVIGGLSENQLEILDRNGVEFSCVENISDDEIIKEYVASDMLVFASTYEGFGMPIVEAQATGRPVVTSNIWSMPEVSGVAACLVDPFDVESIRWGIQKIISDRSYREGIVAKGLLNAKRFKSDVIAGQYAELYRKILQKKHKDAEVE